MGFFSDDMAPMLGTYEAEASELMGVFDEIISQVDQAGAFTGEGIAELFRCAHTIKGSSAMMGLDGIAGLTHAAEDLFDLLRGDLSLADGHVPDLLDHLYTFSDFVKDELTRMDADDYQPADVSRLTAAFKADAALLAGTDGAADAGESVGASRKEEAPEGATASPQEDVAASAAPAADGVVLKVMFRPDEAMVNARAMVIVRQLSAKLKVLSSVPDDLTDPSAAEHIGANGLLIGCAKADVEQAKQLLAKNTAIQQIIEVDNTQTRVARAAQMGKQASSEGNAGGDKFITMRWESLHELQNLTGEFLLEASQIKNIDAQDLDGSPLRPYLMRITHLVDDLAYQVNALSMVSISNLAPQLSRMVRDMCRQTGKRVSFEMRGGDIEVDRNLYNSMAEPLQHIIRNAVDHGIESGEERLARGKSARGKVTLSVEGLGGYVAFHVEDDGCGIDADRVLAKASEKGLLAKPVESYTYDEAIQLVLEAGLSTTQEVTQYSGRGVGMDVVNTVVREFDGRMTIESSPGDGTAISLYMPVALTSMVCLGFRIGPHTCFLPLRNLDKIYAQQDCEGLIGQYGDVTVFTHDKQEIPVLDTHAMLGCAGEARFYVVCHSLDILYAIVVDEVLGEFNCTNKVLPSCLDKAWQARCATRHAVVLEDGTVGYALNASLLSSMTYGTSTGDWGERPLEGACAFKPTDKLIQETAGLFVFELGTTRYGLPVERVERFLTPSSCSPVPHSPSHLLGLTSYHGNVVALYDLAAAAGESEAGGVEATEPDEPARGEDPMPVIVLTEEGVRGAGLVVTKAIGVYDVYGAELAEEQPEPRSLVAGLSVKASLVLSYKEPPVILLA